MAKLLIDKETDNTTQFYLSKLSRRKTIVINEEIRGNIRKERADHCSYDFVTLSLISGFTLLPLLKVCLSG